MLPKSLVALEPERSNSCLSLCRVTLPTLSSLRKYWSGRSLGSVWCSSLPLKPHRPRTDCWSRRGEHAHAHRRERGKPNALNWEILPKNLWVEFGLRMRASDKNTESQGRGQSARLRSRPGPRMPPEPGEARGARQPPPAEGWSEGGLPLMYELWLAIVSHPRSSCRQNKNLLWLIRKTGQLWIDCTQPAHGNINSNEAGWMWWTRCVYVRSQKKGSDLGGVSLNNVISALCLFVRSLPRIRSETLKLSFSCLI